MWDSGQRGQRKEAQAHVAEPPKPCTLYAARCDERTDLEMEKTCEPPKLGCHVLKGHPDEDTLTSWQLVSCWISRFCCGVCLAQRRDRPKKTG